MARELNYFLDTQLFDPTIAAVANTSPASLTNAANSFGSAGTSAANAETDYKKLVSTFITQYPRVDQLVVVMSPATATAMAIATGAQSLTARGGELYGAQVITSPAMGGRLVALDATKVLVADDSGVRITASSQADVEMQMTATSPPTASVIRVNLWASNLIGLLAERYLNYKMADNRAILYSTVNYA
jgi:hypothetical protein